MARTIATSSITEQQNGISQWVTLLAIGILPVATRVTGKFACIVARADLDVAYIVSQVVQPMRNSYRLSQRYPIMVKHLNR